MASTRAVELPLRHEFGATRSAGHPFLVVDVFTETALEGNQLGVFTDARGFDAATMQRLARELNFAETVFVLAPAQDGDLRIRIFTPRNELPFAGHPVLGAAFVAGSALGGDVVRLETEGGTVAVELERTSGEIVFGRFARPAPSWEPYEADAELLAAVGVDGSLLPVEAYPNGPLHVYVALENEDAVAALRPDFAALGELSNVAANCFAGSGTRWTTRMFAPSMGVPEDPATGSAAGPLAMHLARHGWIELGQRIEIHQGGQIGRPSVLFACARGDATSIDSVEVAGSAVIVAHGEYSLR
jgi:trans-2,3-dihydro-3-hydroxyanthranilate isomerase